MAGEPDHRFLFGYLVARRHARPWKPGPRTRPKMPSTPWRVAAVCCALTGGIIGRQVFGAAPIRVVACAVAGFVIGMYVVETVWERRLARSGPPTSPIGRRR